MKNAKRKKSKTLGVYQKKDGRWVVMYRDQTGKQGMEYFGRRPEAKSAAEAFALEIQAARKRGGKPEAKGKKVYFQELAQKYITDKRDKVSQMYIYTLKRILIERGIGNALNKIPVEQLTYHDVTEAIRNEFENKSLSTRQRYLGYLHAIFNYGMKTKLTKSNPLDAWEKVEEPERDVQLTVEDTLRILDVAPEHLRWAITCQWYLVTRPGPSELFALTWDCFDFEKDVASIKCSKTKSKKYVPLRPEFKAKLLEMREKSTSPYVITYKGKPVKQLKTSFKTACKNAGITYKTTLYDLRHLFISVLREGGAPDKPVADLAGHDEITMKKHYSHTLKGALVAAISHLPSIIKKEEPTSIDQFPHYPLKQMLANLS